jgi:hypothetical protein
MLTAIAQLARSKDPEKDLFDAIWDLLQRNFHEVHNSEGRGYNASRAYQSLYRHGARRSVELAVLNPNAEGFGRLGEEGRLDLTYEWFVLNPRWSFSEPTRQKAWEKLAAASFGAA